MRRFVAALALIAVAVSLAACGGEAAAPSTPTTPEAGGVVAPGGAAKSSNPTDTKSPKEIVKDEQMPTSKSSVPQAVLDRLTAKQAMLIYFFDSTQQVTADERKEIDAVITKYRGLIDLVAYDLKSGLGSAGSSVDTQTARAFDMAGLVGVKHTPYMLFVDRYGRITGRFSGYTDRALLEREVLRATE